VAFELLPSASPRPALGLTGGERGALARILKSCLTRYDNLFDTSFLTLWDGTERQLMTEHWQLHAHF
jgi:galactose-1-phosphate uridylyltransferase